MRLFTKMMVMVCTVLLLQSCITIEENYFFKKDGSGRMEYVIDMTELEDILKGFDSPDNDMQQEQKNNIDSFVTVLKTLDNISNIKTDNSDWVQKMSFDFKDVNALNKALETISEQSVHWTKSGNQWTRKQNNVDEESITGDKEAESFGAEILSSMKYKVSVKAKKKISGYNGHEALDAHLEKKSIEVNTDFGEMIKNADILTFSIKVK